MTMSKACRVFVLLAGSIFIMGGCAADGGSGGGKGGTPSSGGKTGSGGTAGSGGKGGSGGAAGSGGTAGSGGKSGSGGKIGSGGTSAQPDAALPPNTCIKTSDDGLIADFTKDNGLNPADGRQGGFYVYGDTSGTFDPPRVPCEAYPIDTTEGNPTCSGPGSFHLKATGFATWGAALGTDFVPAAGNGSGGAVNEGGSSGTGGAVGTGGSNASGGNTGAGGATARGGNTGFGPRGGNTGFTVGLDGGIASGGAGGTTASAVDANAIDAGPTCPEITGETPPKKGYYDASKFVGVSFWAKSTAPLTGVQVSFPDIYTDGGADPAVVDPSASACAYVGGSTINCSPYLVKFGDAAFPAYKAYQIDTDWKRFDVYFADTKQDQYNPGLQGPGDALSTKYLTAMAIQVNAKYVNGSPTANDFEIWVDDINFIAAPDGA
ncbi:MAG TPA: hypothetical protein VIU40_00180, partial [Geobacteraceae bacterium]